LINRINGGSWRLLLGEEALNSSETIGHIEPWLMKERSRRCAGYLSQEMLASGGETQAFRVLGGARERRIGL
jgi:hypothetical protein